MALHKNGLIFFSNFPFLELYDKKKSLIDFCTTLC